MISSRARASAYDRDEDEGVDGFLLLTICLKFQHLGLGFVGVFFARVGWLKVSRRAVCNFNLLPNFSLGSQGQV
ncbi:hypothetical protein MRB53_010432 [Persea americana]|uniref:Uncharacterized protein n=1 Tax=Persea americana TaxID=3435 RepID=A0ACC2LRU5_PERAE|nr:hypothetical protein MRB53_010432 [Persea americana]